jgi:hypothetical protein
LQLSQICPSIVLRNVHVCDPPSCRHSKQMSNRGLFRGQGAKNYQEVSSHTPSRQTRNVHQRFYLFVVLLLTLHKSPARLKLKTLYGGHMAFPACLRNFTFFGVNHLAQVWNDTASRSVYRHLMTTKQRLENNKQQINKT